MSNSVISVLTAVTLTTMASSALAESGEPWVLSPDMGYGYTRDGKMVSYKMGTNNANELFKGAKKVPGDTLFFVGANGQLYMRRGPFLDNGQFRFGPDQ